ncbi:MAG TPA: GNAT family N-acetyltransferase [Acetobacteraceae bacterium]|nr:GNAT family N-acetyltransferase [Acetobacteraceae bacterium]
MAELRAAGTGHSALLAAIHKQAFPADPWSGDAFRSLLALPGLFCFLADSDGLVAGRVAADESEILTLAVVPEVRRRGVGRALLERAMAHARQLGAHRMLLEVAVGNQAALALYANQRFRIVGRRNAYYPNGEAALILEATLSGPACGAPGA